MATDITQTIPTCKLQAGLYIVATPIGNLKDITLRALEVLKNVDVIVCEDTRVTNKLLSHYGIKASMLAYNDHSAAKVRPRILQTLEEGNAVALVSDAGTPLISDPGYKLVQDAMVKDIYVTTIPGPSSVISALTIAGLPTDSFYFGGFLSPKKQKRQETFEKINRANFTSMFLLRNSMLEKILNELHSAVGDQQVSIVREISKRYEEVRKDNISALIAYYQKNGLPKGELVLVIGPHKNNAISDDEIDAKLQALLGDLSVKDAATKLAAELGLPKKQLYTRALKLKKGE